MENLQVRLTYESSDILTIEAARFLEKLHKKFESERRRLLAFRREQQKRFDAGEKPNFRKETKAIRDGKWTVSPVPNELADRRVEITGPASDAKMIINALNSGAKVFMADFEDANSPTYPNCLNGQRFLKGAVRGTLTYTAPSGKFYQIKENPAILFVRPRGWHLVEKHFLIENEPISASLFDFGLFFYHNAKVLLDKGSGPYFYLPKLENALEARLWNDVFIFAEKELGIPQGTIKATVLIETITACFEADEILYELREHSAGLNCGRWDYIFSTIKKFRNHDEFFLPDRSEVTMEVPFMRAYTKYVVEVCHKRKTHAIGGMAAQIPVKNNEELNRIAFEKVKKDKEREAKDGFDGTWVAHPGLVKVATDVFNRYMPTPNQIDKKQLEVTITQEQLLELPTGAITAQGLRTNIRVAIQYIEAWLQGKGAVPLNNLMEDLATAEISRAQVWHWIRHPKGILESGQKITKELVRKVMEEEMKKIQQQVGYERFVNGKYQEALALFQELIEEEHFIEFLPLRGYDLLDS